MTTDRDIRLSATQIAYTADAVRRRRRELARKIATAEANRAAGATIQHGTLQSYYEARGELTLVLEALEVARRQIAHQLAHKLGVMTP